MIKQKMLVIDCKPGMIIAEDIIYNGLKLVSQNTVLNEYIISKLVNLGEYSVCVYVLKHNNTLDKTNNIAESFKRDYEIDINKIKKVIYELTTTSKVNMSSVLQISKSLIKYVDEPSAIIECLDLLKKADEYTYTHCLNVAIYSMFIAKWMNLPLESIKEVIQSGILHDIGKTKIADEILNKPSRLTKVEFEEIKKHTIWGYYLANKHNNLSTNIKNAILMHHERIDGSGYPFGLTGNDIPIEAKIVSVADTFDAMTSNRVYKRGSTPFKAFVMFMTEGIKLYDTSVIFTFLENISAFYIGMKVTLEDDRVGEIMYIPPNDVSKPIIKIKNELIDFSRETDLSIVNIFI